MSLAETAIKRPIFITCIVSLMLILGYTALTKMSVDLFPDVTFPVVFVQTVYSGASPVDVEKLVSKPIEDELSSLAGLETISSTNAEGASYVILKFKIGTDIKDADQQIRQRISNIRNKLPDDILEPIVRRFDPADQPIVRLAVSSAIESGELYDVIDDVVKPQFETIAGVGQVSLTGGRKREIQVLVNKNKVQDYNLSLNQIVGKIASTSKDTPVGKIEDSKKVTVVRASGEFASVDALKSVNINFLGSDQGVRLDSVAEVKIGLEEKTSTSTLMLKENKFDKQSALFLDIYRQSGANTVKVADLVKLKLQKVNDTLKARNIAANVDLVRDGAKPVRLNIADVRESIMIGIILCIIVVFFFLGSGRSTFITGLALPNSLLGGFIIMYAMGFSINIMTLLALSLAVGLLIDDAIVVRENIFRHMEMGKTPMQAAIEGTKEVTQAVIATTLVVIAVFGPIAFLEGIIGQFFRQFGLTIVFTMLISLFDAFTMAPMLSAYLASPNEHKKGRGPIAAMLAAFDRFQTHLENVYERLLKFTLRRPKTILASALVIFIACMSLVAFVPKTFLPNADNGEFLVAIEKPVGTSIDATTELTKEIEDALKVNPNLDLMATTIGSSGGRPDASKASIYVRLVPRKERKFTTSVVKQQIRDEFVKFKEKGLVTVGDVDIGGGGQKPFNLNVIGTDLDQLSEYVTKLKARMEKIPGLVDVDTNYRTGKPEFHVNFDRAKSEALGVSTVTAGLELRARTEGLVAATYREKGHDYDIRVKLDESFKDLRQQFNSTTVPNSNNNMIPLNRIATGEETTGYSQINRQNKGRYIAIDGNMGQGGSLGNITSETEKILKEELPPPAGVTTAFVGQAEDFKDLMANMLMAMFLGVVFIYLVLSSLYESFVTPFAILLALPLGMCGAFVALFVGGKSIDIFSLIGMVMLLGVVAKNSILLVDYTGILMNEGMERNAALLKACKTRLRPILMTSLALIAGMIPIAIGLNEASAQRTSMGVALIGGLVSSTLLTLVVVPAAYGYIDIFRNFTNRMFVKLVRPKRQGPAEIEHGEVILSK